MREIRELESGFADHKRDCWQCTDLARLRSILWLDVAPNSALESNFPCPTES